MGACIGTPTTPPNVIIAPIFVIPPVLKKIITFVYKPTSERKFLPNGTAFFVGIKNERDPTRNFIYMVTAKHVIQDKDKNYFPNIAIKLNYRSGGEKVVPIPLTGDGAYPIQLHPNDPKADIAVIGITPDFMKINYEWLNSEFVATKEMVEQKNITEGDEVFFVGLFTDFFRDPDMHHKKNIPIVRFGRVAVVTDEKIPVSSRDGKVELLDLYLIDAQATPGNSGSPVFFYTRDREIILAGILTGRYIDIRDNSGISWVVPAYKLHEILFSDELKTSRLKNP